MNDTHGKPPHRTERKKAMARHEREVKVYFAVDGEEGYYIGSTERLKERQHDHERRGKRIVEEFPSTHETRYDDEYELIEFAEGMGIPLTNTYRKHHGNLKGIKHKPDW
jgi:glyoxylate utilization-related uncharacterized protein